MEGASMKEAGMMRLASRAGAEWPVGRPRRAFDAISTDSRKIKTGDCSPCAATF
jgi:hypothetical protein